MKTINLDNHYYISGGCDVSCYPATITPEHTRSGQSISPTDWGAIGRSAAAGAVSGAYMGSRAAGGPGAGIGAISGAFGGAAYEATQQTLGSTSKN